MVGVVSVVFPSWFMFFRLLSGVITATSRKLDRETQEEHILEILISDDGSPPLSSVTIVVIRVDDINDNPPEFEEEFYHIRIPSNQAGSNGTLFQVLAFDKDMGQNAQLKYNIKSGKSRSKFRIDNETGVIHAQKDLEPGQYYDFIVKVTDGGNPPKYNTCKVSVYVETLPLESKYAPSVRAPQPVKLTEGDNIGFLVSSISAFDLDNNSIWYDIVDGDVRNEFYMVKDVGNVLIARRLDYETQNEYCLNVSVTDSVQTVYTQLNISVSDVNDERPVFTNSMYKIEISEAIPLYTEILKLEATDKEDGEKLIYRFHSAENSISLRTFMLNSISGVVSVAASLDRETLSEHILTVMVRDGGTPAKKNYARVHIIVHDHNDHSPQFSDRILIGNIFESAAVGSAVLRAYAVDHDSGENARITYSIVSGNIGNLFRIDSELGIISTAKELDLTTIKEYTLQVKATDHGQPPLSTIVPAHIMITMADNEPPKFMSKEIVAEIYEDQSLYSYVAHFDVKSTSSLQFEILTGNVDSTFAVSPNTGVITTIKHLDYETTKTYNLSVMATNMASISATCNVIINILDINDNPPEFLQNYYFGFISESSPKKSLVLTNSSEPLVLRVFDADSGRNALLHYDIVEVHPKEYFEIDSHTGAIKSTRLLDHETLNSFLFHVEVSDLGKPRLFSGTTAEVNITVTDVNDCPPVFSKSSYNVTLLLPSYKNIAVVQPTANDLDSSGSGALRYDIIEGNKLENFGINQNTGLITLLTPKNLKPFHKLQVRVSDGKFSNVAKVYIKTEERKNSGLWFQKPLYEGSVIENTTKISYVCVVNVLGSALNEHIEYSILNPTDMFTIGPTSGVIRTTGLKFDREFQDEYELIVEARSNSQHEGYPKVKIARVSVNVTVLDINDNCPMFVHLPYYAVISVDAVKGSVITKVHAIDLDSAENGEVRYELIKGQGELFKVQRETGNVVLKQKLEEYNKKYDLLIAAYDKGITPCRTDITVHIKIINKSMPVFEKQFYTVIVPENVALHSPLAVSIEAVSPFSRKLIYSIVKGDDLEKFSIEFNTGVISVIDDLDYEKQKEYELIIRATDCVSGVSAEVPVLVILQDINDCPPEFTQESYSVSISESAQLGSLLLTVIAVDKDTGTNGKIVYSIQKDYYNATDHFHIDELNGGIFLKSYLDHERMNMHHLTIVATDQGVPSISSTCHVWLKVLDTNDNPPKFDQSIYTCKLSINAQRGQFVTIVHASDLDEIDQNSLHYETIAGNDQQIFSINPDNGIITLTNLKNFGVQHIMWINVSASDGVFTTFARLKVELLSANTHPPRFDEVIKDVHVPENHQSGYLVAIVNATDEDLEDFGTLTYSICSELLNKIFLIDKISGKITTKVELDREYKKIYEILVSATDGGGLSDFITVRVKVSDENDNAPKFLLKEYKISIHSNFTQGISFTRVKAIDNDEGVNAQIEYSLYDKKTSDAVTIFGINATTGDIYLLRNINDYVGEVFQFFVRASDKGMPQKHSDVPVNVIIMGPNDFPPVFETRVAKFFLSENSATGTIITRLKMVPDIPVKFQIISDSEDNPQFHIDSLGQIYIARPLNFEFQSFHHIGVLALTDSSPPLATLAEIMLQVQDENDHVPQFESSTYITYLAENIEEGKSVLRVMAYDEDQGNNGEVRYDFATDIAETSNFFTIDTHTGWVSTIAKLDKETKSEHKFYVIANDNGTPTHSTRTRVIIRLKDYNDCPTKFQKSIYKTSVNEDALPGTVIITLGTVDNDRDLSTPTEFYIISGDPNSHFQIRQTGEVYVTKSLDRETVADYHLEVIVTDGYFTDVTNVEVTILDVNGYKDFLGKIQR
ncbi:hypothetical protein JTB14_018053 [Gonioctena quinquepunctata]|nr:hypothetical protein JTB14_018053 [Gonioctena quinquepunctata]